MAENTITQIPADNATLYRLPSGLLEIEIKGHAEESKFKSTELGAEQEVTSTINNIVFTIYKKDPATGQLVVISRANHEVTSDSGWVLVDGDDNSTEKTWERKYDWRAKIATAETGSLTIVVQWTVTTIKTNPSERTEDPKKEIRQVNAQVDTIPPIVEVVNPKQNSEIDVADTGISVDLNVYARDDQFDVQNVIWEFDGTKVDAQRAVGPDWNWAAGVPVSPMPINQDPTIIVTAKDTAGNPTSKSCTFKAKDKTPPRSPILDLSSGQDFADGKTFVRDDDAPIMVGGKATDLQSGMIAGQAGVFWSLDGSGYKSAKLVSVILSTGQVDPYNITWKVELRKADYGDYGAHVINLKFVDKDGNSTEVSRNFQIINSYKPRSLEQRLSPVEYLRDLLRFIRDCIKAPGDTPVSSPQLESVFYRRRHR